MRCQYCQDSGKHNVFTTGCSSLASQPYFSACACPPLPNATNDHRAAVEAKSGRDMQRAVATAYRQQELTAY